MGNRKHDIERYLAGEMSPAEMHAFENEALHDPFLAEALEGASHSGSNFLFDLQEIQRSVHHRTRSRRPKIISMWSWSLGIAAGLVLLAVSSVLVINLVNNDKQEQHLASNDDPAQKNKPAEPASTVPADSTEPQAAPAVEATRRSAEETRETASADDLAGEALAERSAATEGSDTSPVTTAAHEATVTKEKLRIVEADLAEPPVIARDSVATPSTAGAPARQAEDAIPHTIRGKVTSATDGKGLPGVNVVVKGTKLGTLSDAEGNYDLDIQHKDRELVFSFIGMKDVEVQVGAREEVNVSMDEDISQLSEVVITGAAARSADYPTLELAEPAGGKSAFRKYLNEEMRYPQQALEQKVEGRVTIEFTVGPDGKLGNFTVLDGLGYGCDDEVIRLIKQGPTWSPSKRNAQPVPDKVKVRLKFKIPDK